MRRSYLVCCLLVPTLIPHLAAAPQSEKSTEPAERAAGPEMDRLAKALVGDWNTAESMVKSQFFPMVARGMVAAMDAGDGTMKTLITTTSTRR